MPRSAPSRASPRTQRDSTDFGVQTTRTAVAIFNSRAIWRSNSWPGANLRVPPDRPAVRLDRCHKRGDACFVAASIGDENVGHSCQTSNRNCRRDFATPEGSLTRPAGKRQCAADLLAGSRNSPCKNAGAGPRLYGEHEREGDARSLVGREPLLCRVLSAVAASRAPTTRTAIPQPPPRRTRRPAAGIASCHESGAPSPASRPSAFHRCDVNARRGPLKILLEHQGGMRSISGQIRAACRFDIDLSNRPVF